MRKRTHAQLARSSFLQTVNFPHAGGRNGRWFLKPPCYDEGAMSQHDSPDDSLRSRWAETWRRAGEELADLRRIEIETVDTQEAIRQIFGGDAPALPTPSPTSGLVEQQAWFARMQNLRYGPARRKT